MKVAFDVSTMNALSRQRGIGVYASNLFHAIKKYTDVDIELIEEKPDYKRFDLIHFPFLNFFTHTLPLYLPKPFVVTIPDIIPLMFPKNYPPGIRGRINWQLQFMALKKAKKIIAISNSVKNDIIQKLKIKQEKIDIVYLAPTTNFKKNNDKESLKKIKDKYKLPDDFVLYIGNTNWNKNILNTTEAALKANKNLVIIGGAFLDKSRLSHPEKKSFKKWLEEYEDNKKIKLLGFVQDEDIPDILNLATCLIFVSFYEGFGLPILESQACEVPVITSNVSATAEIAGKGALLVNPEEVNEIATAVNDIFNSEGLAKKIVESGKENLKRFSWEKTALMTSEVYKNALT